MLDLALPQAPNQKLPPTRAGVDIDDLNHGRALDLQQQATHPEPPHNAVGNSHQTISHW